MVPLHWVTEPSGEPPAEEATVAMEAATISTHQHPALLLVQSAHPWKLLQLTINDSVTYESKATASSCEYTLESGDSCTVAVYVEWPEGTPETAIRLEMQPDYLESQASTLWGYGDLRENVTFQWHHE